jgi:hypothetical protein
MCVKLNVSINYITGKSNVIKTIIKSWKIDFFYL